MVPADSCNATRAVNALARLSEARPAGLVNASTTCVKDVEPLVARPADSVDALAVGNMKQVKGACGCCSASKPGPGSPADSHDMAFERWETAMLQQRY